MRGTEIPRFHGALIPIFAGNTPIFTGRSKNTPPRLAGHDIKKKGSPVFTGQGVIMADENMSFEAAIARLEEIVRALESGRTMLDESLSLFEEGVSLVKLCNERLDGAEQKIKMLTFGPDGSVSEEDIVPRG